MSLNILISKALLCLNSDFTKYAVFVKDVFLIQLTVLV